MNCIESIDINKELLSFYIYKKLALFLKNYKKIVTIINNCRCMIFLNKKSPDYVNLGEFLHKISIITTSRLLFGAIHK